jgi:hypothetical protein
MVDLVGMGVLDARRAERVAVAISKRNPWVTAEVLARFREKLEMRR